MKWIALLIVLGLLPPAIGWMRANPHRLPRVMLILGLLQFLSGMLHSTIAPISWAMWPGYAKGIELTLIDAIAVVLIAAAPARARVAHLRWPVVVYIVIVLISATQTDVPMPTFFYAWQLARLILLITAVAIACRDPLAPQALILGMSWGLVYQAVMSLQERASGATQAAGTFGHQNLLGMLTHFVIFPSLAILLATKKVKWIWLGPAAGLAVAIMTASRGTIGLVGAGIVLLLALSMLRRPTARKTKVAMSGLAAMVLAAPLAMHALGERFERAPLSSDYDERAAFERAAKMMVADYPLGVGANHYVVVANTQGYSDRAGVVPVFGSRAANVHNVYLLAAAETGYTGMVALIVMLAWPAIVALRCAWRFRKDPRGELLVGLAVALIIAGLHSMFEWIFVLNSTEYMYALTVGMIAGIAHQMGYWSPRKRPRRIVTPSIDHKTPEVSPIIS